MNIYSIPPPGSYRIRNFNLPFLGFYINIILSNRYRIRRFQHKGSLILFRLDGLQPLIPPTKYSRVGMIHRTGMKQSPTMNHTLRNIGIVGGGSIGLALATELLRTIRRHDLNTTVHLFERNGRFGMENSERSLECVRTYFRTAEEIVFYKKSIEIFSDLAAYFGEDSPTGERITASYQPCGYHYFVTKVEWEHAQKDAPQFDDCGVPIDLVPIEEAEKIDWISQNFDLSVPILGEKLVGYVHVPVAGFINSSSLLASYYAIFEHLGGRFHANSKVLDVELKERKITALIVQPCRVDTGTGTETLQGQSEKIDIDCVINCAGVWADTLNKAWFDRSLGIVPHRRIVHVVMPPKGYYLGEKHGLVIVRGRTARPDGDRLWLYYAPDDEASGIQTTPPDNTQFDGSFFNHIQPVFCDEEKPFIREAGTIGLYGGVDSRGWLGHYADSPDQKPFIGLPWADLAENYWVSTGYSGHGVMASSAAGLGLADLILENESRIIIPSDYAADRDPTRVHADGSRL